MACRVRAGSLPANLDTDAPPGPAALYLRVLHRLSLKRVRAEADGREVGRVDAAVEGPGGGIVGDPVGAHALCLLQPLQSRRLVQRPGSPADHSQLQADAERRVITGGGKHPGGRARRVDQGASGTLFEDGKVRHAVRTHAPGIGERLLVEPARRRRGPGGATAAGSPGRTPAPSGRIWPPGGLPLTAALPWLPGCRPR